MTDLQNENLASLKTIVNVADSNPIEVALVPAFAKEITVIKGVIVEIDSLAVQQSKNITGITNNKNDMLEDTANYVIEVSGAVRAYAASQGDKILQARLKYGPNRVHHLNQAQIIEAAAVVLEEAGKLSEQTLSEQGITKAEMESFTTVYNSLSGVTTNKREAVIEHSNYTDRIANLFAQAADIKKHKLEPLSLQFQRKAPEFYLKYKAAADVIRHRTAKKTATQPEAKA
jgi:hypothetical protein